jgi:hypothetical protein
VFVELMPLLTGRTVLITVAREDENPALTNFELHSTPSSASTSPVTSNATFNRVARWSKPKQRWKRRPRLPRTKHGRRLPSDPRR